jgi:hypothetical protein
VFKRKLSCTFDFSFQNIPRSVGYLEKMKAALILFVLISSASPDPMEVSQPVAVIEKILELMISMMEKKDLMANIKSISQIAGVDVSFSGILNIQNDLSEILEFWRNLKQFHQYHAIDRECDNTVNLVELRDELVEGFRVYKVKYEPIIEYLHHAAESAKFKSDTGPKDSSTLQAIVDGTQQIKGTVDSILVLLTD